MDKLSDYLYRKASDKGIPLDGTFELSPICNYTCKMCYIRKTPEQIKKEGKTLRDWKDWIEMGRQGREAGMLYLLLTGGEPFLYPNFKELYIELSKMGFLISINTNGTLIKEEEYTWLKKYPPHRINITLYGASNEVYKRICGDEKGYDKTIHTIEKLQDMGFTVVINASMIPENSGDLEKIIAYGKKRNLLVRIATYMFPPVRREKEETDSRFSAEEAAEIYMRRVRCTLSKEEAGRHFKDIIAGDKRTASDEMLCRAGRTNFWINWEGKMTACGMTSFPLEVYPFEEGLQKSWIRLTNAVKKAEVLKGCKGCSKRNICRPCVAMILAETGEINKKSTYLCTMSENIVKKMQMELEGEEK